MTMVTFLHDCPSRRQLVLVERSAVWASGGRPEVLFRCGYCETTGKVKYAQEVYHLGDYLPVEPAPTGVARAYWRLIEITVGGMVLSTATNRGVNNSNWAVEAPKYIDSPIRPAMSANGMAAELIDEYTAKLEALDEELSTRRQAMDVEHAAKKAALADEYHAKELALQRAEMTGGG